MTATDKDIGIAIRFVREYDIVKDLHPYRLDIEVRRMTELEALRQFVASVRFALASRIVFDGHPPSRTQLVGPVGTCEAIESALEDLDKELADTEPSAKETR